MLNNQVLIDMSWQISNIWSGSSVSQTFNRQFQPMLFNFFNNHRLKSVSASGLFSKETFSIDAFTHKDINQLFLFFNVVKSTFCMSV